MTSSLARSIFASARTSRQRCLSSVSTTTTTPIPTRSLSTCAVSPRNNWKSLDLVGPSANKSLYNNNNNNNNRISRFMHGGQGAVFFSRPYHVSIRNLESFKQESPDDNTKTGSIAPDNDSRIQPQHSNPMPPNTDPKARMLIGFTCTVCNHRAHKTMSKHAYNHGVVIMQCDHCKNRHLIADHLGWFRDGGVTVEDLVKAKGETVQKLTRSFQLVKDGHAASSSIPPAAEPEAGTSATKETSGTSTTSLDKPKTELELALEKAAMGTLEWIPKDILQDEEMRMRKSQESLDLSKKQ